jgi:hypothetical protein
MVTVNIWAWVTTYLMTLLFMSFTFQRYGK